MLHTVCIVCHESQNASCLQAQDEFVLTYHGEPLNRQMRLLVKNALHYYLQLAEIEKEESY